MEIKNKATAGVLENNDIFVVVEPNGNGIDLHLESTVCNQFGEEIEKTVQDVLNEFKIENIKIQLKDRGAVDYAIRARVEAALKRAGGA